METTERQNWKEYEEQFTAIRSPLQSYLYRLLTDKDDAEDAVQETFIRVFKNLQALKKSENFKAWVFRIATNFAYDQLKARKRWTRDILDQARDKAIEYAYIREYLKKAGAEKSGTFELREHIDFCFTCVSKTIPLEQQVALMLVDIYDFGLRDAAKIMQKGEAATKHYIRLARQTMQKRYENRCALINKQGICHQCSQLNNWLNPRANFAKQKHKILWVAGEAKSKAHLFRLRETMVKGIDPLNAEGSRLHEAFMQLHRHCAGERDRNFT